MVRIATRLQTAINWSDDGICPKIEKTLKNISKGTICCKAYMSKPGEYEIHEGKSQFPLSLNSKLCSCGAWQLCGIPCRHAIRAMLHAKIDPHQMVSSWYSISTYKQTYSHTINPVPDKENWPAYEGLPLIMPPTMKRGVGRPSRNRRREEGEDQKGKRSKTVMCKNCDHFDHNTRTCKGGPTGKDLKVAERLLVRNPRVRDQTDKGKAAAKERSKAAKETAKASQPSTVTTQSQQED